MATEITRVDVWAAEIEDPGRRQVALEKTLREWRSKDPTAAQAWMEENSVELDAEQ